MVDYQMPSSLARDQADYVQALVNAAVSTVQRVVLAKDSTAELLASPLTRTYEAPAPLPPLPPTPPSPPLSTDDEGLGRRLQQQQQQQAMILTSMR